MIRINRAVAVLGLGLAVLSTSDMMTSATSFQTSDVRALRKGPPDGPKKPPKRKHLPHVDDLVSPIASVDIG